jgi:2-polyprenyl-3-methyl-5-hydroxy-6-metoxy-1,4-benzoquinol methylase
VSKASRVGLFDDWAETYDASVQEVDFPFDGYELVLDEVARLAAVQPGMRILELGIGTGNLTKRLANSGCAIRVNRACRQARLTAEYRQVSQFGGVYVIGISSSLTAALL